jgi:hypothetical protein
MLSRDEIRIWTWASRWITTISRTSPSFQSIRLIEWHWIWSASDFGIVDAHEDMATDTFEVIQLISNDQSKKLGFENFFGVFFSVDRTKVATIGTT